MSNSWTIDGSKVNTTIWVNDETGKRICTLYPRPDEKELAAKIAAIPDLVAALQYIESHLSAAFPEGCAELNKARAALAKAQQ